MIEQFINSAYQDPKRLQDLYRSNDPFPHIVLQDFIAPERLRQVAAEFPNLCQAPAEQRVQFHNQSEVKFASRGVDLLSPAAFELVSFLNSEYFLRYLQELTGIREPLLSDPYLAGGGYHQINQGGYLKVHADFNRHPQLELDRRLNLLLYLNDEWDDAWGGDLQLFDEDMQGPVVRVPPRFNTCVVFSTMSRTFHGHPDPLACPQHRCRRSLALYYFSTGRPEAERSEAHSTVFRARRGSDDMRRDARWWLRQCVPPIFLTAGRRLLG